MGVFRNSASALRNLTQNKDHGSSVGRRSLAQLSQTLLKPSAMRRPAPKESHASWLLPASLALLGLSFSTFCTHQLVATSNSHVISKSSNKKD